MDLPKKEDVNGIFAVYKPSGITSQDAVSKLKFLFGKTFPSNETQQQGKRGKRNKQVFKIGHGGTLDPLAEGVLVIGVGNGTKQLAQYLGECVKEYRSKALLGCKTTTYDAEGAILEYGNSDKIEKLTVDSIKELVPKFTGEISQLPPVFSALKIDGKPLYAYAREKIELPRKIELRACTVDYLNIGEFKQGVDLPQNLASEEDKKFAQSVIGREILATEKPVLTGAEVELSFSVSSGTYIRSLINDIGEELGTKAFMSHLIRQKQGEWVAGKNAIPLKLFDKPSSVWWPLMQTALNEGPQRELDLETEPEVSEESQNKVEE